MGPYGEPLKSTLHVAVSEANFSFDKDPSWASCHVPAAQLSMGYKMSNIHFPPGMEQSASILVLTHGKDSVWTG